MHKGEIATVCEDPDEKEFQDSLLNDETIFVDDVSHKVLNTKLVRAARADEIQGVHDYKVFDKVPIKECWDNTGENPVSTRWLDLNKGDDENPDYRSRWVARQFKGNDKDRDDLFAATPPLEANKMLIAKFAAQRNGPPSKFKKLSFIDIRKAFFCAKAKRLVYVELPAEFCEPGEEGKVCGRLNYSLYGTRDAANNWADCYSELMVSIGFAQGASSPCVFYHK